MMRKAVVVAICSLVLATVALGSAAAASARDDVFRGFWASVDLDGSHQTLDIRGTGRAGHHAMFLFDDFTSGACGGPPAHVQGSGVVYGDHLVMTGTMTCMPGGNPLRGRISIRFVYDSARDTLTDDSGVTWFRA